MTVIVAASAKQEIQSALVRAFWEFAASMRVIKCGLRSVTRGDASLTLFEGVVRRLHEAKVAAHLL